MKKIALFLAGVAFAASASASTTWTLQGKEYRVDTLFHCKVGPGTTQTSLALSGGSLLRVHYTTTDLTDPNVDLRVTKASDKLVGCNTLSAMCKGATREGARYFAGVNADFFGGSQPIGSCVVDGEVYYGVDNTWVSWYMTEDKTPGIATLGFHGTAVSATGSHAVAGVNTPRYENNLVIYNKRKGANTGTNVYGYEVTLTPVDGTLNFTGTVKCRVGCEPSNSGSMAIPADGYVLSGNGTAQDFVKTLHQGDEVSITLNPEVAGGKAIMQMAGGQPAILSGGQTLETQGALDHLTALNPRTAVGFNADATKVVLLVVDGRASGFSVGVVSKVLADIMRETGCTEAMNFDGGGSSELYSIDFGVRNRPSDGRERAVTNAVWAVATSPTDDTVAEICFVNPTMVLPKYGYYEPVIYAYNKYGVLISTELKGVTLSCPEGLGTVLENGTVLFANGSGTHALTAHYGDITATIPVTIGSAQPEFRLADVLVDPWHDYKVEVTAKVEDRDMKVENTALTWTSSNPEVAAVSDLGEIHGVAPGDAVVTGVVESFSGSVNVKVEVPEWRHLPVFGSYDAEQWKLSRTGVKNEAASAYGNSGFAIDYTVSSTRGTSVTMTNTRALTAIPDSLRIVVNPGDAKINSIIVKAGARSERPVSVTLTPTLAPGVSNVLLVPVSDFVDTDDFASYPLTFSAMIFNLGDSSGSTHRIEVSDIEGVYVNAPENSGIGAAVAVSGMGESLRLSPNPAEAGAVVTAAGLEDTDCTYGVYTAAGMQVKRGSGCSFSTAGMASGVYLVCVTAGTATRTARLVVR